MPAEDPKGMQNHLSPPPGEDKTPKDRGAMIAPHLEGGPGDAFDRAGEDNDDPEGNTEATRRMDG